MGIPKLPAFCLTAPGVRFIVLAIAFTEVLFLECVLSWRTSCAVHARLLVALAIRQSPLLIMPTPQSPRKGGKRKPGVTE
jgi:hypothetical protein